MNRKPEHWRDSNDYRGEYFRNNPSGFLGLNIFFCSQCGKPMRRESSDLQIDHILPPSAFARKRYKNKKLVSNTSPLARTFNSSFNTTTICAECNRYKSDKMGLVTVKGTISKGGEIVTNTAYKAVSMTAFGIAKVAWAGVKLITKPFSPQSPTNVKIGFIVLYGVIIFYLFHR